jgi:hypothetical protein
MLNYVHSYTNTRPNVDWNTCGQAAISTMLYYHNRNPFNLNRVRQCKDARDGRYHWDDGAAIDATIRAGFGPDVVFGLGSTGGRIRDALRRYGLNASVGNSGFAFWGWQNQWNALQNYLNANRPVPVCVDTGLLGGPAFGAHWAIAYRVSGGRVALGAMGRWNGNPTVNEFLSAWQCRHLPFGFNHCGVYC